MQSNDVGTKPSGGVSFPGKMDFTTTPPIDTPIVGAAGYRTVKVADKKSELMDIESDRDFRRSRSTDVHRAAKNIRNRSRSRSRSRSPSDNIQLRDYSKIISTSDLKDLGTTARETTYDVVNQWFASLQFRLNGCEENIGKGHMLLTTQDFRNPAESQGGYIPDSTYLLGHSAYLLSHSDLLTHYRGIKDYDLAMDDVMGTQQPFLVLITKDKVYMAMGSPIINDAFKSGLLESIKMNTIQNTHPHFRECKADDIECKLIETLLQHLSKEILQKIMEGDVKDLEKKFTSTDKAERFKYLTSLGFLKRSTNLLDSTLEKQKDLQTNHWLIAPNVTVPWSVPKALTRETINNLKLYFLNLQCCQTSLAEMYYKDLQSAFSKDSWIQMFSNITITTNS